MLQQYYYMPPAASTTCSHIINRLRLFLLRVESSKSLQVVFQGSGCHYAITKPKQVGTQNLAVAEVCHTTSRSFVLHL